MLFSLFFILIIIPGLAILFLLWILTRKKIFGKLIGAVFIWVIAFILFLFVWDIFHSKKELKKEDYYGTYVVDRNYFKGKQADWQYNHYRFEIKENDSIYFYQTYKDKILKTYKGTISTVSPYVSASERLTVHMEEPTHHIIADNPTISRDVWDFHLIFNSKKFSNVFFKKGEWKPIQNN